MAQFLFDFIISVNILLSLDFINGAVVQVSNPFDPYRLECPHKFAVIKLTLQRVDSIGKARNDTLVASFCENIAKLYPSDRDDISPADDEDCRWTTPIEIPGQNFGFNEICSQREFIAGISRQEMLQYTLPTLDNPEIAVERNQLLLSSLAYQDEHLIAQFCDYAVMNQDEIDQEIINESKSKLAAWFAAAQIANPRPTIVQGQTFVKSPTPSPQNNGQSTLFPGDNDDYDNNGDGNNLPVLIPRDKNEFVAITTQPHQPTTRFTLPTIGFNGLKVLRPNEPIRYSLSPEELAAFPGTRPSTATDKSVEDNEVSEGISGTTPRFLQRQRASLAALLKNRTRTREPRTLFYTSTSTSTSTTATPTTVELDDGLGETPAPVPAEVQQRASLGSFLNKIVTTRPTTITTPTTTVTVTPELDDTNNEQDIEATTLLPAVEQQRVSLAKFLNKIVTTRPPTPTTITSTVVTTADLDDNSIQSGAEIATPIPALLLQRASLGKLLNKIVTKPATTVTTTRKTTTPLTTTEEVATEESELETEENPVDQRRISIASLLHKVTTTRKHILTTTPTTTTTSVSAGNDNELEDSDLTTAPDPVANRRSSLEEFLNKIDSSTKLPITGRNKKVTQSKESRSSKLPVVDENSVTSQFVTLAPKKRTKRPKTISTTTPNEEDINLEIGSPAETEESPSDLEAEVTTASSKKARTKNGKNGQNLTTKKPSKKPPTTKATSATNEEEATEEGELTETPVDEDTTIIISTTEPATKAPTVIKVKSGRQHSNFLTRESKRIKLTGASTAATATTTTTESSPDVIEISIEEFASLFTTSSTTVKSKKEKLATTPTVTAEDTIATESEAGITESVRAKTKSEDLPDVPAVIVVPTDYDLASDAIPLQNKLLVKAVSSARQRVDDKGLTEQADVEEEEEGFTLATKPSTAKSRTVLAVTFSTRPLIESSIGPAVESSTGPAVESSTAAAAIPESKPESLLSSLSAVEGISTSINSTVEITSPLANEATLASVVFDTTRATAKHKKNRGTRKPDVHSGVKTLANGVKNKTDDYYYYYYYEGTDKEEPSTPATTGLTTKNPQIIVKNEAKIICNTTLAATAETSGLVIACGVGSNIWIPPRCPQHTFCMESSDTNFRICCPALFVRV